MAVHFTIGAAVTALYLVRDRAEVKADGGPSPAGCRHECHRQSASTRWLTESTHLCSRSGPSQSSPEQSGPKTLGVVTGGGTQKETWAFITWVIYAGYLHARATAGWRGRKAAVICLVGYVAFLINYFGVNFYAAVCTHTRELASSTRCG